MNPESLEKIYALAGMDELKAFAGRLTTAARNIEKLNLPAGSLPLPSLIFFAPPGIGISLHLRLLTGLIEELRLLPFEGDEKCFEWVITPKKESFDRFLLRVKHATGFYSSFRGIIGVHFTEALFQNEDDMSLRRLMEYVDANQGKILFVFIPDENMSRDLQQRLLGLFVSRTPCDVIHMSVPNADELGDYALKRLKAKGFSVKPDAEKEIRGIVTVLRETELFEGYQTLNNLVDELIWRKLSLNENCGEDISQSDIDFVYLKREYAEKLKKNRSSIGF